jgi:AcrR family transcriptional regulator
VASSRGGVRPRAGRPRVDSDAEILDAARRLLLATGFRTVTIEEIARAAGVSVGALYRRWPSKAALAVAALSATVGAQEPVDTGQLRADLRALVPGLVAFFTGESGRMLARLLHTIGDDAPSQTALREATAARRVGLRRVLERAETRGELSGNVDIELAMDLVMGPLWARLLVTGEPITPDSVADLMEFVADILLTR